VSSHRKISWYVGFGTSALRADISRLRYTASTRCHLATSPLSHFQAAEPQAARRVRRAVVVVPILNVVARVVPVAVEAVRRRRTFVPARRAVVRAVFRAPVFRAPVFRVVAFRVPVARVVVPVVVRAVVVVARRRRVVFRAVVRAPVVRAVVRAVRRPPVVLFEVRAVRVVRRREVVRFAICIAPCNVRVLFIE
jgi:hypothetical protein